MRELDYIILDLEEWCSNSNLTCDFCSNLFSDDNKAVCQIRTRSKATAEMIANDFACESCKDRIEELIKCERCGRLLTKVRYRNGKYVCRCVEYNEDIEEKELPNLPDQRESMPAFYERQINSLQEQLNTAEWTIQEEREAHEDFMEKSEEWGKKQKQELLDRIKELEAEVERLKKQTPQALVDEIESLKSQLEKFQQAAQIETPPKDNKIKNFFKSITSK